MHDFFRPMSILLVLFFVLLAHPLTLSADKATISGKLGYLIDGIHIVRYKEGQLAFATWIKELSTEEDVTMEVDYYRSDEKVLAAFEKAQLDALVVNPIFYLRHQQMIDSKTKEYWMIQKSEERFQTMLLLTKRTSGIDSIAGLKGKSVATRDDNYMGRLFLDTELLRSQHVAAQEHVKDVIGIKRYSTAILQTFFGKVDACIVPENTFRLVSELNPAVAKELKVLKRSTPIFFPVLGLIYQGIDETLLNTFDKNIDDFGKSVGEKNILDLFKIKGMYTIDKEELQPLRQYYDEYLALSQRYGGDDE